MSLACSLEEYLYVLNGIVLHLLTNLKKIHAFDMLSSSISYRVNRSTCYSFLFYPSSVCFITASGSYTSLGKNLSYEVGDDSY